jgi:translation elongation factor EF-Ts
MGVQDIARLREETGAGMLDVKKALDNAGGDYEKAKEAIMASGLAKAEKKGARVLGGQELFMVACDNENTVKQAREILSMAKAKLPCKTRVLFEKAEDTKHSPTPAVK